MYAIRSYYARAAPEFAGGAKRAGEVSFAAWRENTMRRSAGLLIPITIIISYYAFWTGLTWLLLHHYPARITSYNVCYTKLLRPVYTETVGPRAFAARCK